MTSFKDLGLIIYTGVLNSTMEVAMKNIQFIQHSTTTFKRLTKNLLMKYTGAPF